MQNCAKFNALSRAFMTWIRLRPPKSSKDMKNTFPLVTKKKIETLFCCNGCNLADACGIVNPYLHLLKDSSHAEDDNCWVPWVGPFGGWDSLALSGLNTEIWFRSVGFQNCFGIYSGWLLISLAVQWSDLELNFCPHRTAKSLVYWCFL
jgi:hypothetical protein